ncbi:putative F-box/fbd/LRR-repeat protein [Abeliophyllum distichum]|uniref:F-box/fbd/LRR-repeat protein n=1 Tax=Abeliophyllum distichum TaxID=126358 RepID=A0ABD1SE18_9LAMI
MIEGYARGRNCAKMCLVTKNIFAPFNSEIEESLDLYNYGKEKLLIFDQELMLRSSKSGFEKINKSFSSPISRLKSSFRERIANTMSSKSKSGNVEVEGDQISCLPDAILSHILSLIPLKSAVQTSILSKRWTNLWTFITNIEFEEEVVNATRSVYMVDSVLSRCTSKQIDRFSLVVNVDVDFEHVKAWANDAVGRNVRELRLKRSIMPQCIFTCKTLTFLELVSDILFHRNNIPTSFDLPNLKTLRTCLLYPKVLANKLFSSCPILEDLTIEGTVRSGTIFNISCPLLKTLKMDLHALDFEGLKCKFVINAPNVKYLELIDMSTAEYVVENLNSVVEAKMEVVHGSTDEIFVNRTVGLLREFCTLKSLSLDEFFLALLNSAQRRDLPTFHNMIRLELFANYYTDQRMIARLLNVCPNLEVLILHEGSDQSYLPEQTNLLSDLETVPECLLSHVKVIELEGLEGNSYEMEMVKYLLANARVLKYLTIKSWTTAPELDFEIFKQLVELPKGSTTCGIHIF